jgi:iron(III) transport system substrate-binding protein
MATNDDRPIGRRQLLRGGLALGAGLAGLVLAGCGSTAAPASSATASAATSAKPAAAGSAATSAATSWDDMVAGAKKEGTVVLAGPPDADTRSKLPDIIKQKYGIDVQYLSQNSSQIAARMQAERAAGQYTVDLMLAGADSVYNTLAKENWLDPLKSALVMPGVADGSKWKAGGPWFRDAKGDTVLQLFNTVTTSVTVNSELVKDTITKSDDLLDPKWKGKIASFDPSVNGIGLQIGSSLYVSKGEDYLKKLYVGQNVALTADYRQIADYVAHGSYPIAIGVAPTYLDPYRKSGIQFGTPRFSDAPSPVSGGFGLVVLINRAPHPNAARVVANWLANTEGMTMYSQTQVQVPVRTDIDPTWIPKELIPQSGVQYFDGYDPQFLESKQAAIKQYFTKLLK